MYLPVGTVYKLHKHSMTMTDLITEDPQVVRRVGHTFPYRDNRSIDDEKLNSKKWVEVL